MDFLRGKCNSNEISYMGYSSNGTLSMGKFYLRTDSSFYGSALGFDGIKTNNFLMTYEDGRRVTRDSDHMAFQAPSTKLIDHRKGLFNNDLSYHKYNEMLNNAHHHSRNKHY